MDGLNTLEQPTAAMGVGAAARIPARRAHRVHALAVWLLPLGDLLALILCAQLASLLYAAWPAPAGFDAAGWNLAERWALLASIAAPFILRDPRAGTAAAAFVLARRATLRYAAFAALVLLLAAAGPMRPAAPWLALWLAGGWIWMLASRLLLPWRHREVVAIVGAGVVADRLIEYLQRQGNGRFEVIGVFDDRDARTVDVRNAATGRLADLVTIGRARPIDWVLLTVPGSADRRVFELLRQIRCFNGTIGLCPQDIGLQPAPQNVYLGADLPVTLLAEAANTGWELDDYDLDAFTRLAANFGQERYSYVVTPNVDHLIRLHEDAAFRSLYADAGYVLLDSRFLARALSVSKGMTLPVCAGSDLTARLFESVIRPDDPLVLIGGSAEQARLLAERYGLTHLAHHNPPMGFIHDAAAVEDCLTFVEAHSPFRYCLLAVGAPQQEIIARELQRRGVARGLALCIGASINFLTGNEKRAPQWMQHAGFEWLYRLLQAPGRLAKRDLLRGPRVFGLLPHTDVLLRRPLRDRP